MTSSATSQVVQGSKIVVVPKNPKNRSAKRIWVTNNAHDCPWMPTWPTCRWPGDVTISQTFISGHFEFICHPRVITSANSPANWNPGRGCNSRKMRTHVHGKVSKPTVITPFMRGAIIEPRLLRQLVTRSVVTDLMWTWSTPWNGRARNKEGKFLHDALGKGSKPPRSMI